MYNFYPYTVFLTIIINIPVLLMTAFVLQGHFFLHVLFICIILNVYIIVIIPKKYYNNSNVQH